MKPPHPLALRAIFATAENNQPALDLVVHELASLTHDDLAAVTTYLAARCATSLLDIAGSRDGLIEVLANLTANSLDAHA
jgi:hypothetical protein